MVKDTILWRTKNSFVSIKERNIALESNNITSVAVLDLDFIMDKHLIPERMEQNGDEIYKGSRLILVSELNRFIESNKYFEKHIIYFSSKSKYYALTLSKLLMKIENVNITQVFSNTKTCTSVLKICGLYRFKTIDIQKGEPR